MPQRFSFDPSRYGPALSAWVDVDRCRPLDDTRAASAESGDELSKMTLEQLLSPAEVVDRSAAGACLAGVWLLYDRLDASHAVSQSLATPEGSYWHGIMHRREGDFSNAKYWFRQVGVHEIDEPLADRAQRLAAEKGHPDWAEPLVRQGRWSPAAFVDACAAARESGARADFCRAVQQAEWEILFDHCFRRATSIG